MMRIFYKVISLKSEVSPELMSKFAEFIDTLIKKDDPSNNSLIEESNISKDDVISGLKTTGFIKHYEDLFHMDVTHTEYAELFEKAVGHVVGNIFLNDKKRISQLTENTGASTQNDLWNQFYYLYNLGTAPPKQIGITRFAVEGLSHLNHELTHTGADKELNGIIDYLNQHNIHSNNLYRVAADWVFVSADPKKHFELVKMLNEYSLIKYHIKFDIGQSRFDFDNNRNTNNTLDYINDTVSTIEARKAKKPLGSLSAVASGFEEFDQIISSGHMDVDLEKKTDIRSHLLYYAEAISGNTKQAEAYLLRDVKRDLDIISDGITLVQPHEAKTNDIAVSVNYRILSYIRVPDNTLRSIVQNELRNPLKKQAIEDRISMFQRITYPGIDSRTGALNREGYKCLLRHWSIVEGQKDANLDDTVTALANQYLGKSNNTRKHLLVRYGGEEFKLLIPLADQLIMVNFDFNKFSGFGKSFGEDSGDMLIAQISQTIDKIFQVHINERSTQRDILQLLEKAIADINKSAPNYSIAAEQLDDPILTKDGQFVYFNDEQKQLHVVGLTEAEKRLHRRITPEQSITFDNNVSLKLLTKRTLLERNAVTIEANGQSSVNPLLIERFNPKATTYATAFLKGFSMSASIEPVSISHPELEEFLYFSDPSEIAKKVIDKLALSDHPTRFTDGIIQCDVRYPGQIRVALITTDGTEQSTDIQIPKNLESDDDKAAFIVKQILENINQASIQEDTKKNRWNKSKGLTII